MVEAGLFRYYGSFWQVGGGVKVEDISTGADLSQRKRIVVIDDEPDLLEVMKVILRDYEVQTAAGGQEGLAIIRAEPPDLILVDSMMPGVDGVELVRTVKDDAVLRYVPIIMVTAKGTVQDRVKGLQAGADDYVVKPFSPEELVARVQINLRRTERDLDANPLTRLPGNAAIMSELERRLLVGDDFAVCYVDLDRFKAFNDTYGFARGDEVIKHTAQILRGAVRDHGRAEDLVGHIGGDDFILVTIRAHAEGICEAVIARFDEQAHRWYDAEDIERGHLRVQNRRGDEERVSLVSISIGIVRCEGKLRHPAEIGQVGAELKHYAKSFPHSIFVWDRRQSLSS